MGSDHHLPECYAIRSIVATAMFGRNTRSMPAKPRLRPIGHRPQPPRRASGSRSATPPREEWIEIPVPALIDEALFEERPQVQPSRKIASASEKVGADPAGCSRAW